MTSGKATGTATSAELLAADRYRGKVTIMLQNAVACAIGIGEDAVVDEGVLLAEAGDIVELTDEAARAQINILGDTASVTYQTGPVVVRRQPATA